MINSLKPVQNILQVPDSLLRKAVVDFYIQPKNYPSAGSLTSRYASRTTQGWLPFVKVSEEILMPPRQRDVEPVPSRRMSDVLICFSCCVTEQPPPRRRRIDRSMIGLPTNFIHTGHIGSGDMSPQQELQEQNNHLNSMQTQMQSKGGYSGNNVDFHRNLIDVKRVEDNGN